MARAVSQPLLLNATGLPEGARYFGFVILGRPPTAVEPAPTVPSNRAVVCVADLIGEPRTFGGRRWSPIINSPAEVLELIDAANGQLVTVVRAAFLPDPPSGSARPEPAGGLLLSPDDSTSILPTDEPDGHASAALSPRQETGPRRRNAHGTLRSSRGAIAARRLNRGRHRRAAG